MGSSGVRGLGLFIFTASFFLYLLTLAPDVLGHDSGEFQFVPYLLGIAHHTGYPLYTLLGKVWTLLPLGTPAYRMNLFSALFGALTLVLIYKAGLLLSKRWLAAALVLPSLALSPTFWEWSTIAGVRSSSAFLVALTLYLALRWGQERQGQEGHRLFLSMAFALGLGLAHHRSILLLLPALLAYIFLVDRSIFLRGRLLFIGSLFLGLPLLTYLYLPLRARLNPPFDQFHPGTWEGFLDLVLGGSVASALFTAPLEDMVSRLGLLLAEGLREFGGMGLALAMLGALWLGRRDAKALLLLGIFLVGIAALGLGWNLGPGRLNTPFLAPGFMVLALLIGLGGGALAEVLERYLGKGRRVAWLPHGLLLLLWLPFLVRGIATYRFREELAALPLDGFRQDLDLGPRARRLGMTGLPLVEPEAIVVADWEQATVYWYLQLVEGVNPSVEISYPSATWREVERRAQGRPHYSALAIPELVGRPLTMVGSLVRLLERPSHELPQGIALVKANFEDQIQLEGYVLWDARGRPTSKLSPWGPVLPLNLYWRSLARPRGDYSVSVRLYQEGRLLGQTDSQHPVLGLYPTSSWEPGQVVADYYEVALKGLEPGKPISLEVLLYTASETGFQNLRVLGAGESALGARFSIEAAR